MTAPPISLEIRRHTHLQRRKVHVAHDLQQVRRALEQVRTIRVLEQISRRGVLRVVVTRVLRGNPLYEPSDRNVRHPDHQPRIATGQAERENFRVTPRPRHGQQLDEVLFIRVVLEDLLAAVPE
jgi:hypothetical protein